MEPPGPVQACNGIALPLQNLNIHYCVQNSPSLHSGLNYMNPIHTLIA